MLPGAVLRIARAVVHENVKTPHKLNTCSLQEQQFPLV